jgi:hypothetical protein
MRWDLGLQGLGLLAVMALGFGLIAHLVARWVTRWMWAIASVGFFLAGLVVSEVWFGWATQAELQPNIDGLSFDEVLLFGMVASVLTVVAAWSLGRARRDGRRPS